MATDLAEVLGGALALYLLFGLPLLAGGVITALVAMTLLVLQGRGHRPVEAAITGCWRSSWWDSSTAWSRAAWTREGP